MQNVSVVLLIVAQGELILACLAGGIGVRGLYCLGGEKSGYKSIWNPACHNSWVFWIVSSQAYGSFKLAERRWNANQMIIDISTISQGKISAFTWKWNKIELVSRLHSTRFALERNPRKTFFQGNRSQNLRHVFYYPPERTETILVLLRGIGYITKADQTILPFVTQCKLPDPSELNIKRALYHLKLAP